jgi:hypothetical protein
MNSSIRSNQSLQIAACDNDELLDTSNVLKLFFQKVFGKSDHNRLAANTIIALSSVGNVVSMTYTDVLGNISTIPERRQVLILINS